MKNICRCLLVAVGLAAYGAELEVNSVSVQRGMPAVAMVRLATKGDSVAALQFDVECDPELLLAGSIGQAAAGAGKILYSADIGSGRRRFLLVGLNGKTIGDGAAVELYIAVGPSPPPGAYPLRIGNGMASDPNGNPISLSGVDGSVVVSDEVTSLSTSGVFAHIAAGAGWKTSFTLMNLAPTESPARLVFWNDDGGQLELPIEFPVNPQLSPMSAAAADVIISSKGVVIVEAATSSQDPVRVGWAQLQAPVGVVGWATFGRRFDNGAGVEAVVPMATRSTASMVLPFDNSNGFSTGVALVNESETSSANVLLTFRNVDGQPLHTDMLSLALRGHRSFSIPETYPNLAGFIGSVELKNLSGGAISGLGLRFSQSGSITSISPVQK